MLTTGSYASYTRLNYRPFDSVRPCTFALGWPDMKRMLPASPQTSGRGNLGHQVWLEMLERKNRKKKRDVSSNRSDTITNDQIDTF